jgi:hypothetical protein
MTNETMNINDHQMVFFLAAEMNKLNGNDKNLSVEFIPWIQNNRNGLVYTNGLKLETGLPPTRAQIALNASLGNPVILDTDTLNLQAAMAAFLPNSSFSTAMARNMFKAHKDWIGETCLIHPKPESLAHKCNLQKTVWAASVVMFGLSSPSWSTISMARSTQPICSLALPWLIHFGKRPVYLVLPVYSLLTVILQLTSTMYFTASSFRTIDGGLNRLPLSFHPHVDNIIAMNRKIERVTFDAHRKKVRLYWRDNYTTLDFYSSEHDYAVISAPFSIVRKWRLPPLSATISNAIQNLPYQSGCKVALEFSARFWEHYETPIFGGCSTTTDIPGIGEICYPSYNLNSTGPASILASWVPGDWGGRWAAVSEAEHVQYVLDTMVEIHGEFTRELYTGKYNRRCWILDESGGWAHPSVGQHQLYMPEYFKTHSHVSSGRR